MEAREGCGVPVPVPRPHCSARQRAVRHGGDKSMNRRPYLWLVLAAALAVAASGCEQSSNSGAASGGKPLNAEPTTGGTFSEGFHPHDTNSVSSSMGTPALVNQPLVAYDH